MAKQSKQNRQKQKMTREQRDNQVLGRVFNLFLLGIAAECYLLLLNHRYVNGTARQLLAIHSALPIVAGVGFAVLALGVALMLLKKGPEKVRRIYPWLVGLGAFFGVTSLMLRLLYPKGGSYLCVIIPILTVLGLVYYLFQREFFTIAVVLGGSMFTVWICRKGLGTANWGTIALVGSILVLAGLAAIAFFTRKLQHNGGKWGKTLQVFPSNCDYRLLYAAYAIAFLAVALALVLVSTTYYSLWALGILLFAFAVYYTTKLM